MWRILITLLLFSLISGCVGSPVHETLTYSSLQSKIKSNNQALLKLRIGMQQSEVRNVMNEPERSEGYAWGSAWLYRTAMTSGIYGTADTDFTPVMFNQEGELIGWGRNFFESEVKRYELSIRNK